MADNDLLCPTGMGCIDVEIYCGTVYTYYSLLFYALDIRKDVCAGRRAIRSFIKV